MSDFAFLQPTLPALHDDAVRAESALSSSRAPSERMLALSVA